MMSSIIYVWTILLLNLVDCQQYSRTYTYDKQRSEGGYSIDELQRVVRAEFETFRGEFRSQKTFQEDLMTLLHRLEEDIQFLKSRSRSSDGGGGHGAIVAVLDRRLGEWWQQLQQSRQVDVQRCDVIKRDVSDLDSKVDYLQRLIERLYTPDAGDADAPSSLVSSSSSGQTGSSRTSGGAHASDPLFAGSYYDSRRTPEHHDETEDTPASPLSSSYDRNSRNREHISTTIPPTTTTTTHAYPTTTTREPYAWRYSSRTSQGSSSDSKDNVHTSNTGHGYDSPHYARGSSYNRGHGNSYTPYSSNRGSLDGGPSTGHSTNSKHHGSTSSSGTQGSSYSSSHRGNSYGSTQGSTYAANSGSTDRSHGNQRYRTHSQNAQYNTGQAGNTRGTSSSSPSSRRQSNTGSTSDNSHHSNRGSTPNTNNGPPANQGAASSSTSNASGPSRQTTGQQYQWQYETSYRDSQQVTDDDVEDPKADALSTGRLHNKDKDIHTGVSNKGTSDARGRAHQRHGAGVEDMSLEEEETQWLTSHGSDTGAVAANFRPDVNYGTCPWYVSGASETTEQVRSSQATVIGVWMRDTGANTDDVWVVEGDNARNWNTIGQYPTIEDFRKRLNARYHDLEDACTGMGPVVFKNHLYCQSAEKHKHVTILKISLLSNKVVSRGHIGRTSGGRSGVPYRGWAGVYLHVHLMVDEKGLWALMGETGSKRLVIYSLDPDSLHVVKSFYTSQPKDSIGPAFMSCGVLYALDSHYTGHFAFIYDTSSSKEARPAAGEMTFPHMDLVSLQYNPRDQKLYAWKVTREQRLTSHQHSRRRIYAIAEFVDINRVAGAPFTLAK